jgi:hypothetical protein
LLLLCALFACSLSLSLAFPSLVFSGCSHYQ